MLMGIFINACIYAIPRGDKIGNCLMCCPSCRTRWKPGEGITLLGRLFFGGKCNECGERRHWRHSLIILLNAAGWAWIMQSYGINPRGLAGLLIFSFSLVVAFIDLEHYLIPNGLVLFLLLAGAIYYLTVPGRSLLNQTVGLAAGFAILFLLAVISGGGVGGGDVKLAGAMGFWLGYPGIFNALFWGALAGSIIGISLMILGFKKHKDPIPFGPFLLLGFCISFFN